LRIIAAQGQGQFKDTGGKFATGINDTSGKYANGINDTISTGGKNFPLMSSLKPVVHLDL
jgi:hypothetical protein